MENNGGKNNKLNGLWLWSRERFPVLHWFLAALFFSGPYTFQKQVHSDFQLTDMMSFISSICFFLVLRVFDEHKDYALDCINHPHRILQKGIINLRDLKILGILAATIFSLWTLFKASHSQSNLILLAWAITVFWALLMAKEFFVGDWLEKNLPLYGFSHMVILMPVTLWFMCLANPELSEISLMALAVMTFNFFCGLIGEVSRKTYAPDAEREKVDSYTKYFGIKGTCKLLFVANAMLVGLILVFIGNRGLSGLLMAFASLAILFFAATKLKAFVLVPSIENSSKVEKSQGIFVLTNYVLLILTFTI